MNQADQTIDTRAALIDAGRKLFSAKGFSGTSVRDLTAAAKVNLGAVTYHFGGKEGLYQAVVDATLGPLSEELVEAASGDGPPLDRVAALVRAHFFYLTAHPELAHLLLRGVLESGTVPVPAGRYFARILAAAVELIREGQHDGTIRPGHPTIMAIGIVSQSIHLTLLRGSLHQLGGIDLAQEPVRASVVNDIVRSVRGGLAARGD